MPKSAAHRLADFAERVLGGPLPVAVRTWDGHQAGPAGPTVVLKNRRALRWLLYSPGELGLARAYVSGDLDVEGDLTEGFRRAWAYRPQLSARDFGEAVRLAARLGVFGLPPKPPAEEARLRGKLHTLGRDRSAISHHYDLSNAFYQLLMDDSMAYSSGYWSENADLARAQHDKLELICRKLGLRPGMRLLDVGCGWGSLLVHAAKHHGVEAVGVTISAEQVQHVKTRLTQHDLDDRVEVRRQDYRELAGESFDAVASIEMGEHVGEENYPAYAGTLCRMLKPTGRLLLQQMSRGAVAPGGGAFIERYIAPDMTMRPLSRTLGHLETAGFEIRDVHALREHYVPTVRAWADTLERHWDEAVALIGEAGARVWRLYLAGGALAFEENRMGVDQILAVRPDATGRTAMPWTREWA
ncbi:MULTISPECIES: SAM-dependent methyltransferase [Amycolatopsis]|uniref:Class I SAM-dependent methyltransferase n=1 Tax=Amycolatopsis dendrobii TaxID=2760662 RepID=A0A7W3W173_9PSEU|nr:MULTISPECIES: cyclopropane-fatty-acyl-phospholipid synthase family protein [Amycolatopsis]MBB1156422.1 class I SAM-dependent methyltransferase [Amycolatopsis dendrobii]UKD58935.1 cyclopropane-fatty-acyl-phospholipid synthase family protein [Amycolatopsis sp. FU40]